MDELPPIPPDHTGDGFKPLRSRGLRWLLLAAGHLSVVLGIVGVLLPIVPGVPFFVLAAACYARASRRFFDLLLDNRFCGPAIRDWRRHHSLPRRSKLMAIAVLAVSFATSITLFVPVVWGQACMGAVGIAAILAVARIPTRRATPDVL